MDDRHWSQRPEGGGRFALWLIRNIVLRIGRPVGRLLLYPITLYFLVRRGVERRASMVYLERVLGRPPSLLDGFRHVHSFAATILDRPLFLTGRMDQFDVRCHGLEQLQAQMAQGKGVLLLGAHVGSFEALRVLAEGRDDVRVAVLLDRAQNPALTQLLEALNPVLARSVIDASQPSTELVLKIREAAESGALVGMLGDRRRAGEPGVSVPFLGRSACFPVAPYLIAAALGIPVCLCFGLYHGGRRYDLHFETFADRLELPRGERQRALDANVRKYAERVEHHVRLAPYNWFNFYDFWLDDWRDDPPVRRVRAAGAGTGARADRPGA